jgi:putative peptide zinc metalloprotease protein
MRRLALLALSLLLALAFAGVRPGTAWAEDGDHDSSRNGDNAAVAINTQDGSSIFKLAFSIRRVTGDVVDETNTAVAYNECEQCRAVAVAIQIVLVVGSPSVVTPGNVAVAVNYQCTLCESLAMAYQFVIGVPADFHFTGHAMSEIREIRREIWKLRKEDLTIAELRERIDALAQRLRVLIRGEIERHEARAKRERDERERGQSPQPPPVTTTPTETDTETFPTITDEEPTTTETAPTDTTATTTEETVTTETTTTP